MEIHSLDSEHTSDEDGFVEIQTKKLKFKTQKPIKAKPAKILISESSSPIQEFASEDEELAPNWYQLYCYYCDSMQPLDNFSKKEQSDPKHGPSQRICLLHRINSGLGPTFNPQTNAAKWDDALLEIEQKYGNRGDELVDEEYDSEYETEIIELD